MQLDLKNTINKLAQDYSVFTQDFTEYPPYKVGDIIDLGYVDCIVVKIDHLDKLEEPVYRMYVRLLGGLQIVKMQAQPFIYSDNFVIPANEIVVLSGMSASGKDTVAQMLAEKDGYNFIVSTTTRPMRPNEEQGKPYYFVNKEEFDKIPMIETRSYNTLVEGKEDTWYYGVAQNAVAPNKKYVVVLDIDGMEDFKKVFGNRVKPIYINVPEETRKARSESRGGHDETEWNRREKADSVSVGIERAKDHYPLIVSLEDSTPEELYSQVKRCIKSYKLVAQTDLLKTELNNTQQITNEVGEKVVSDDKNK